MDLYWAFATGVGWIRQLGERGKNKASSSSAALLGGGGGGGVRSHIGVKWQLLQLLSFVYITVMLGSFQTI